MSESIPLGMTPQQTSSLCPDPEFERLIRAIGAGCRICIVCVLQSWPYASASIPAAAVAPRDPLRRAARHAHRKRELRFELQPGR